MIPPHLKCAATLPCEICVQEIAMFKNCVNINCHARHIQWNVVEKILVQCCTHYSIHRQEDICWATHRITDCTQLPQQRKKLCSKILLHIINVQLQSSMVLVGKSKLNYTSLIILSKLSQNRCNNSQQQLFLATLKISGEFFIFQQDSSQEHGENFLDCNFAKCWLILKFFHKHTRQWS